MKIKVFFEDVLFDEFQGTTDYKIGEVYKLEHVFSGEIRIVEFIIQDIMTWKDNRLLICKRI